MFNQNRFVKPYKYKQKHPLSGDADLRLKPVSPFEKKHRTIIDIYPHGVYNTGRKYPLRVS